jgi:hypothetical protein
MFLTLVVLPILSLPLVSNVLEYFSVDDPTAENYISYGFIVWGLLVTLVFSLYVWRKISSRSSPADMTCDKGTPD